MTPNYHAFVHGVVLGPFTLAELQAMEVAGTIQGATLVKGETHDEWCSWQDVRPLILRTPPLPTQTRIGPFVSFTSPHSMRVEELRILREGSLYPTTRRLLFCPAWISVVVSVVGWGAIASASTDGNSQAGSSMLIPLAIASTLWALVLFLISSVARAVLDMADRAALSSSAVKSQP